MKNKPFVPKIVFLVVFLSCYLFARNTFLVYAEESVQDVIKLIQEKSKDIKSYQAKFNLNMKGPQGEMAMNGDIKFKRPDKLKMELSLVNVPDAKQLMISDGNTMWQYVPALKMASKIDISTLKKEFGDTYLSQTKEDISQPLKDVEENSLRYLGKENIEGKEFFILEAKPKALPGGKEAPFAKIKIWIDSESGSAKGQ
ncbi:MAG: outer membrane lipoprotein-sorting protein [Candidatus Omnitrophica bacterium]|nr:outer membrane lipoprotein-sorting protein [Candidatus Omnitrophota bacterium]